MLEHQDSKRWMRQFDSLWELTRWLETAPKVWSLNASRQSGYGFGQSWDLGHGYDGARHMAETGWEDGVQQLAALAAVVPTATLATRSYSVAGMFPDVPRAVAGDPFNMVRRGKVQAPRPTVTIAVNTRVSCAVSAKEAANFGAAMVALVDRLETNGVRVELLGLMATSLKRRFAASWTIKRAQDHLDLGAVAFSLAHPGMFRRLGFAAMERSPRDLQDHGYGNSGGITSADFVDVPEGALLISGVDHNPGACRTMDGALAFAKARINEASIAMTGEPLAALELEVA